MSILIGQHEFDGPVRNLAEIPAIPGLYAVLHKEDCDLFLVEIDQSIDLASSVKDVAPKVENRIVVVLPCNNRDRRKEILHELVREFEFDDDEPTPSVATRRTETKSGVTFSI